MAVLDVRELIEMAVKDEETGIAFYEALAEETDDPKLQERFTAIANQERHHKGRFQRMLDEIGDYKPLEQYPGEYEQYVQSLLQTRAFPQPDEAAKEAHNVGSKKQAIDTALQMERDTVLFLTEMNNFVETKHTEYIQAIIQEERDHVVQLTDIKKKFL